MKKKVLIWVLAAVLVLSMAGCAAGAVSSNDKYVGMEPTAAAELPPPRRRIRPAFLT